MSTEAEADVCYLTTRGRRTARSHTIEIWFTVIPPTAYLISGGRDRSDWVKNLLAHPEAKLRIEDQERDVVARLPLADGPERVAAVTQLHAKYARRVSGTLDDWLADAFIVALDP